MAFELLIGKAGATSPRVWRRQRKSAPGAGSQFGRTGLRSDQHDSTWPVCRAPARAVITGADRSVDRRPLRSMSRVPRSVRRQGATYAQDHGCLGDGRSVSQRRTGDDRGAAAGPGGDGPGRDDGGRALAGATGGATASRRRAVPQAGDDRGRIRFRERLHVPRHLSGRPRRHRAAVRRCRRARLPRNRRAQERDRQRRVLEQPPLRTERQQRQGQPLVRGRLLRRGDVRLRELEARSAVHLLHQPERRLQFSPRAGGGPRLRRQRKSRSRCHPRPSSPSS